MRIIDKAVNVMPALIPIRRTVGDLITAAIWLPMRMAYRQLHFEIVGFCNARCPYCTTGIRAYPSPSKIVSVTDFRNAIALLLDHGLIARRTKVHLYNWGEPMLHPKLNELLHVLRHHGLHFRLSTNGSKFVSLDKDVLTHLDYLNFSVPGFSQNSYDRIHKLDFQKVTANIEMFCQDMRIKQPDVRLAMAYHVYRFNTHEVLTAMEFCRSHGIEFTPYNAFLNDFNLAKMYLDRTMPPELLGAVKTDLRLDYVDESISSMPPDYRCPQFTGLAIDEICNVLTCCLLPKDHPNYSLGSIFDMSTASIRKTKLTQRVCIECTRLGIAWWLHHPHVLRPSEFLHPNRNNETTENLSPVVGRALENK